MHALTSAIVRPFFFCFVLLMSAAFSIFALQRPPAGGNAPPFNDQQRAQQMDQIDQRNQQYQQEQALRHSQDQLAELQRQIRDADAERLRLKAMLRENFRRHYETIRKDSQELVQLTSNFPETGESAVDPPAAREMITKSARIEKLAHEIRENMAGRHLPKARPAPASPNGPAGIAQAPAIPGDLLTTNSNQLKAVADELRNAVEKYLASDNEQEVSVGALQRANEKQHFDPNSLAILNNSLKLEQLARKIRSEIRALYPSR